MSARAAHGASAPAAFTAPVPAPPRRRTRALCACTLLPRTPRRTFLRAQLPLPQPDPAQSATVFDPPQKQPLHAVSGSALSSVGDAPDSAGDATASADNAYTGGAVPRVRLSLPTPRERKWLQEGGVRRGRSRAHERSASFTLRVFELLRTAHPRRPASTVVPPWAYVVHIHTPKIVLGKRATTRNRAKRRLRAACARVLPLHAYREREYVFTATPDALVTPFAALVIEVAASLRAANSHIAHLPFALARRRRSPSKAIPVLEPTTEPPFNRSTLDVLEDARLSFIDALCGAHPDDGLDNDEGTSDTLSTTAGDSIFDSLEHSDIQFSEASVLCEISDPDEGFVEAITVTGEESAGNDEPGADILRQDQPDDGFTEACLVEEQESLRSTLILNTTNL